MLYAPDPQKGGSDNVCDASPLLRVDHLLWNNCLESTKLRLIWNILLEFETLSNKCMITERDSFWLVVL